MAIKANSADIAAAVAAEIARRDAAAGADAAAGEAISKFGLDVIVGKLTAWRTKREAVTGWAAWGHVAAPDKNRANPDRSVSPLTTPYPALTELIYAAFGLQRAAALALLRKVAADGTWYFKATERQTANGNPVFAFGLKGARTLDLKAYE